MFIFRRLSETDADFKFITGNKAFDEISPDGSLSPYLNEDIVRGGEYCTYLLIEDKDNGNSLILGLLRYKFTNKEQFQSEFAKYEVEKEIEKDLLQELIEKKYSIIYLSRIGVEKDNQDMHIGQIISNFFEFLVKRKRERLFIYVKVIDKYKDFIATSYDFIAKNDEEKWGRYYLACKFLVFDK